MSGANDTFDLRRLVEQAVLLKPNSGRTEVHPIGLGLPSKHSFAPGYSEPRLRFPKLSGPAAKIAEKIKASQIPTLSVDESEAAWAALLRSPTLVIPLKTPTADELRAHNLGFTPEEVARSRAVGIASVVIPDEMRFSGPAQIARQPVAAVGRIMVTTQAGSPQVSIDGSLSISWTTSTATFVKGLHDIYVDAIPKVQDKSRITTVGLFLGDSYKDTDLLIRSRWEADAAVHRYRLQLIDNLPERSGETASYLRTQSPSALAASDDDWNRYESLLSNFERFNSAGTKIVLTSRDWTDLRSELCEKFCDLVRVTPGLLTVEIAEVSSAISTLWPPIKALGNKRVHPTYGPILQDSTTGLWYTKDHARHGGSAYKCYRLEGDAYVHASDIDSDGKPMQNKHKGPIGKTIPYGHTSG